MVEKTVLIRDPIGIHARPAAGFIEAIRAFDAKIELRKGEKSADARSILSLMGLGAKEGDELILRVEGPDEEVAAETAVRYIEENL